MVSRGMIIVWQSGVVAGGPGGAARNWLLWRLVWPSCENGVRRED